MSVFDGLVFCVSGHFTVTQGAIKQLIEDNGGTVVAAPTKKCDVLVADVLGSAKCDKAQANGTAVVTESWVRQSIQDDALSTAAAHILAASATIVPTAPAAPATGGGRRKAAPKAAGKTAAAAAAAAKVAAPESESDSEDDAPAPKPTKKRRTAAAVAKAKTPTATLPSAAAAAVAAAESDEDDDDDVPAAAVKMQTVTLKSGSRAPVDARSGKVATHHVYEEGDVVFDAALNQTDISNNNNKSYSVRTQTLRAPRRVRCQLPPPQEDRGAITGGGGWQLG